MGVEKEGIGKWVYVLVLSCVFLLVLYLLFTTLDFGKFSTAVTYHPTSTTTSTPVPTNTPISTPTPTNTPLPTLPPTATASPTPTFTPAPGQREVFDDLNPDTRLLELWRIEHDWNVTAEMSYHFQDPFSFDGRYVVSRQDGDAHVFDLYTNRLVKVLYSGQKSTWARHSHQLFYYTARTVWRYDVDNDETVAVVAGTGAGYPRTISRDDRYLFTAYGGWPDSGKGRGNTGEIYRVENVPGASVDNGRVVQLTDGWQYASEPRASSRYDVIVFKQRRTSGDKTEGWWSMRFDGSLEENRGSARLLTDFSRGAHGAWLGNGEYFILGDGAAPLPKKIKYLGGEWGEWEPVVGYSLPSGDPAAMGYSGRWLVLGAGNRHYLNVIDTETGKTTMVVHYPSEIIDEHPGDENLGDPDAHGSPDGTKVAFVCNYDLKSCPTTQLTGKVSDNVPVRSTAGFPDAGVLGIRHHLVAYTWKTPTSFEGITVGALGTGPAVEGTWRGIVVTNFACRSGSMADLDHQYRQDLYIAVYRLPDVPSLSVWPGAVRIVPGENHREIMGYRLHGPGGPILITFFPTSMELEGGEYAVSAVEWSGLESALSNSIAVSAGTLEIALAKNS